MSLVVVVVEVLVGHGDTAVVVDFLCGVVDFLCGHGVVLDTSGMTSADRFVGKIEGIPVVFTVGIPVVFTVGANTSSTDRFVGIPVVFITSSTVRFVGKTVVVDTFVTLAAGEASWVVLLRPKICSHAEIRVVEEVVELNGVVALSGGGVVEVVVFDIFPSQGSGTPGRRFLGMLMLDKQAEKVGPADLHVPAEKVQQPIHSHSSLLQPRSQMSPPLARVWNIWKVGHSSVSSPTHLPSWKVQQPMK